MDARLAVVLWLAALWLGGLALWLADPLGWLWVASQVQAATDNTGAAFVAGFAGFLGTLPLALALLGKVNSRYQRARMRQGLENTGSFPLETVLVVTAIVVGGAFVVWFLGFSGTAPLG